MQTKTIQLLKPCNKENKMNCWESLYIQIFQQQSTLIDEQKPTIHLSHGHKMTRHVVQYPPQFSTHHPSQVTSTQGNTL